MNKALKVILSIFVFPLSVVFGLLFAIIGFVFFPVYACDILYSEIWGYSNNE